MWIGTDELAVDSLMLQTICSLILPRSWTWLGTWQDELWLRSFSPDGKRGLTGGPAAHHGRFFLSRHELHIGSGRREKKEGERPTI